MNQNTTPEKKCIEWKGLKNAKGYGIAVMDGKQFRAHRLAVALSGRNIPKNKVVDHLCRNTSCINPEHLRICTNVENVMAGIGFSVRNKAKTACENGHPFDEQNTYISSSRKGSKKSKWRGCRKCKGEVMRKLRQKKHGK